jgi:hypothetical protein
MKVTSKQAPGFRHGATGRPRLARAAASIEYVMILGLVVLPIALMMPLFLKMVSNYGNRMLYFMRLPFP